MGYHTRNHRGIFVESQPVPKPTIEVEAILVSRENDILTIQLDETAPKRQISRRGIKIQKGQGPYVILNMTENKALQLDLI